MKKYIISLLLFSHSGFVFPYENLNRDFKVAEPKLTNLHTEDYSAQNRNYVEISDSQLENNKSLIEHFINLAVDEHQENVIPDLLKMYQKYEIQDQILNKYALGAYYHSTKNYNKAINHYKILLTSYPDLDKVRFKLSEWLLEDHQYSLSKRQIDFLKKRLIPDFIQQRIGLYNKFINDKQQPHFRFRASYIQDNNINNASSERYVSLNGTRFKKSAESLPQKTRGINYHFNFDKLTNIINNHNFYIENELSGKYYWNNKKYNEIENIFYLGYQYQNFNRRLAMLPLIGYQWIAQKRYSHNMGGRIEFDYQISRQWQFSSVAELDKTFYKFLPKKKYKHLYSTTIVYTHNSTHHLFLGFDFIKENFNLKRDSSLRYSMRLGIQKIWGDNFISNINLQYAKRYFKGKDYLLNYKRKDNEWGFSTIIARRDWDILGFIPKLQYRYHKIDSNISEFFSFDKQQVNLFFEKKF